MSGWWESWWGREVSVWDLTLEREVRSDGRKEKEKVPKRKNDFVQLISLCWRKPGGEGERAQWKSGEEVEV